jgi:hypothetical protein
LAETKRIRRVWNQLMPPDLAGKPDPRPELTQKWGRRVLSEALDRGVSDCIVANALSNVQQCAASVVAQVGPDLTALLLHRTAQSLATARRNGRPGGSSGYSEQTLDSMLAAVLQHSSCSPASQNAAISAELQRRKVPPEHLERLRKALKRRLPQEK